MGTILGVSETRGPERQVEAGLVLLDEPLLNVAQAASLLNVRESWVRAAARAGRLPCVRVGRHLRFSREQLQHWLGEQCTTTPAPRLGAVRSAGRARSRRASEQGRTR
jgi:excisionase family DNA binding protein